MTGINLPVWISAAGQLFYVADSSTTFGSAACSEERLRLALGLAPLSYLFFSLFLSVEAVPRRAIIAVCARRSFSGPAAGVHPGAANPSNRGQRKKQECDTPGKAEPFHRAAGGALPTPSQHTSPDETTSTAGQACPCQKPPCTKITLCNRLKTRSG